ncbi:MAG: hypothetical protein R6V37_09730, partial [Psychroflexus maritimus]
MLFNNLKTNLKALGMGAVTVVFMSSCGSYHNVGANDGIYGSRSTPANEQQMASSQPRVQQSSGSTTTNTDYSNYFGEQSQQISQARGVDNGNNNVQGRPAQQQDDYYYEDEVYYDDLGGQAAANPGWGSAGSNVTVNVMGGGFYDPFWGPGWGYGGFYGPRWGWGGFYGPGWGWGGGFYNPAWGWGGGFYSPYAYNRGYRNAGFANNRGSYANGRGVRSNQDRYASTAQGRGNVRSNRDGANARSSR